MIPPRPLLSVIVPAHQAARLLPDTLQALAASDLPRPLWELIVVDDASLDGTDIVAGQFADTVVRLAGNPHGPAYARNRASEFSRGDVLVFVDADVRVHPDALRLYAELFVRDQSLGAAFGSYDDAPAAPGLVSQYRNLLHHYVHQGSPGDAETFWAGLGAVRRGVFDEAGLFNEWHYARPQIEDIELGRRIRQLGWRITLCPDILGTHLKRWTFGEVLRTDFRHRGVPWAWLILAEGRVEASRTLNLQLRYKVSTVAAGLGALALAAALPGWSNRMAMLGAALLVLVLVLNVGFYRLLARRVGIPRACAALPMHLVHYMSNSAAAGWGWLYHHLFGEPETPATVAAFAAVGVKTWPPAHSPPRSGAWAVPATPKDGRDRKEQFMTDDRAPDALPPALAQAFAPIHKRAFGMALGTASAVVVFFATAIYLLRRPEPGFDLSLLREYFTGYTVTWRGAFVGAAWGFFVGFVGGWFFAFCRNISLATWLFVTRTRAELAATRDFLDHI